MADFREELGYAGSCRLDGRRFLLSISTERDRLDLAKSQSPGLSVEAMPRRWNDDISDDVRDAVLDATDGFNSGRGDQSDRSRQLSC